MKTLLRNMLLRILKTPKTSNIRRYEAGKSNRVTIGWLGSQTQIDQDIRQDLTAVRARARESEQNDGIARKYIRLCRKNVPGAYGFTLHMKVGTVDIQGNKIPDKVANNIISDAWEDWKKKAHCDVSNQLSFRSMQHLEISHAMRDGEFLARGIHNNSKYGFQLQMLDPEMIDETHNIALPNGNVVIMGVEFDLWRRRVAYWLKKYQPQFSAFGLGYTSERERVSANQIYYDFDRSRAFQSRGMSEMSASMLRMWKIKEWESASVTNATISARRLGFVEQKPEENPSADLTKIGTDKDDDDNIIIDTEDGSYHLLPRGYHINQPETHYPHQQHEMFMKSELRLAASGLDVSYMNLASDPGDANYSSARVGMLDERETWMMLQEWFIESFLEPVFHDWLESAFLKDAIVFPDRQKDPLAMLEYYDKPYFVGRRWPWVDPEKDAQAVRLKLKMGLTSLPREAAQNGDDLEELFAESQEATKLAEKYGVTISFDDKQEAKPVQEAEPLPGTNGKGNKKQIAEIMEN